MTISRAVLARIAVGIAGFAAIPCSGDQVERISGTCDQIKARVSQTGVIDSEGKPHPGFVSWTNAEYHLAIREVVFDSQEGESPKELCLRGTFEFSHGTTLVTSRLAWDPTGACDTCGCAVARDIWDDEVKKIVGAQRSLAKAVFGGGQSYSTFDCTRSTVKDPGKVVREKLLAAASAYARLQEKTLERMFYKQQRLMAGAPGPDLPDCNACTPCPPGQQPSCTFCPPPYIKINDKCLSPCGPIIDEPFRHYENCGISDAQQPVACCEVRKDAEKYYVCSPKGNSTCDGVPQ